MKLPKLSKMKLPKIINNKYILYLTLILSIINVIGFLNAGDNDSVLLFIITGLLSSYFSKNMIVIGGPCANSVAAALEGKSADACGEGYEPGQSFLKMVESGENVAVLAFGYDAAGTLKATDKLSGLASSDNANLGTEVPLN